MGHVARIIGAEYKQEKLVGQKGPVWRNVEPTRQKEALQFLLDNAYTTPTWLLDESILRKIEASGSLGRVGGAQARALASVVSNDRLQRMLELEAMAKSRSEVYPLGDMLTDLRRGLWKEVDTTSSARLQRVYLKPWPARQSAGRGGCRATGWRRTRCRRGTFGTADSSDPQRDARRCDLDGDRQDQRSHERTSRTRATRFGRCSTRRTDRLRRHRPTPERAGARSGVGRFRRSGPQTARRRPTVRRAHTLVD
jgi:hypothetical protein